jgi:hypothetical protein
MRAMAEEYEPILLIGNSYQYNFPMPNSDPRREGEGAVDNAVRDLTGPPPAAPAVRVGGR